MADFNSLLGYVGLPLAVEFGNLRPVAGFDTNAARIAQLRAGQDATLEVSSDELRNASHLTFTDNLDDLADCNTFIVTVPPQSMPTNAPISRR